MEDGREQVERGCAGEYKVEYEETQKRDQWIGREEDDSAVAVGDVSFLQPLLPFPPNSYLKTTNTALQMYFIISTKETVYK